MAKLGDYFSSEEKTNFISNNLRPGKIIYIYCDFTNPRKNKYLVIVSNSTYPFLFVINSKITEFVQYNNSLLKCYVKLNCANYEFLLHDSYINCFQVFHMDKDEIVSQIILDMDRIKGELSLEDKEKVIEAVSLADTLAPRDKRLIIQGLRK